MDKNGIHTTRLKLETVIFVRQLSIKNTAAASTKGLFKRLFTGSCAVWGFRPLLEDTFSQRLGTYKRKGQRKKNKPHIVKIVC